MKYAGNPWPHWNDVSPLMSVVPKRSHLHRPSTAKSKHSQKQKTASAMNSTAGPSGMQDPLAGLLAAAAPSIGPSIGDHSMPPHTQAPLSGAPMYQMPVDDHGAPTDQMDVDNHTSSSTSNQAGAIANTTSRDPNSIPPSTPSTFLTCPPQSTVSMASTMTSVSQKRKVSSLIESNAGSEGSKKRSRPLSATAQAKADGDVALQRLSNFFKNINPLMLQPVTLASLGLPQTQTQPHPTPQATGDDDYSERAAEALMSLNLSPSENNNLADYMSDAQNKMRVKFFLKFDPPSHKLWIKNALAEIQARKDHGEASQSGGNNM